MNDDRGNGERDTVVLDYIAPVFVDAPPITLHWGPDLDRVSSISVPDIRSSSPIQQAFWHQVRQIATTDAAPEPRISRCQPDCPLGWMIVNEQPHAGLFSPSPALVAGAEVSEGEVVGSLGDNEIRSRFTGRIAAVFAELGERLAPYQRIAWLSPWDRDESPRAATIERGQPSQPG